MNKLSSPLSGIEASLDIFEQDFFDLIQMEDQIVAEYFYCKDKGLKYNCEECTTEITKDKIDAILREQLNQLKLSQGQYVGNILGFSYV